MRHLHSIEEPAVTALFNGITQILKDAGVVEPDAQIARDDEPEINMYRASVTLTNGYELSMIAGPYTFAIGDSEVEIAFPIPIEPYLLELDGWDDTVKGHCAADDVLHWVSIVASYQRPAWAVLS